MSFLNIIIYNIPTSYVSIDINPSVMIGTNFLEKAIKINALNSDADTLIKNIDYYGEDIENLTNEITDKAIRFGYIDKNIDDNTILISTYCNNENQRKNLQKELHNNLNQHLNKNGIGSLIIDTELSLDDAKKANEYGVSEAKILFVKKAIENNPELKFEDLIYLPAREIAKYIDDYNELNIEKNNFNNYNNSTNSNGQQRKRKNQSINE